MTATTMKSRPFAFGAMLLLLFQPSSSSASSIAAVAFKENPANANSPTSCSISPLTATMSTMRTGGHRARGPIRMAASRRRPATI